MDATKSVVTSGEEDPTEQCATKNRKANKQSASASGAEPATAAVARSAAKQAEAEDDDADFSDSEDELGGMTSMEYITTHKELPPHEVRIILRNPVKRVPFAESDMFKEMSADPDATQDDIDEASREYEGWLDRRIRFYDWVRSEYKANGYVAVSEEYMALRAQTDEMSRKLWEELARLENEAN